VVEPKVQVITVSYSSVTVTVLITTVVVSGVGRSSVLLSHV
jgi:hypothetical protein